MLHFSRAISALQAHQAALNVVGNNIANANTPDYHRQEVRLVDRHPVLIDGLYIGQGVRVARIDRAYQSVTEEAITRNISENAGIETRLQTSRQIEGLLTPGRGSVLDRLETFFNELERLTAEPDNPASRTVVARAAASLADEINSLDSEIDEMIRDIDLAIEETLGRIETLALQITEMNVKVRQGELLNQSPNDLKDKRDRLVNELAQLIDISIEPMTNTGGDIVFTQDTLRMADGRITVINDRIELNTFLQPDGQMTITKFGSIDPIDVVHGKLGGLLIARNEMLMSYENRLEEFTQGLVEAVDSTHATGIGFDGSFDVLLGQRGLDQVDVPLQDVESIVDIKAGSLFINVTAADGTKTLNEVVIDPTVDTLEDVATRISAIANIQATVDATSGQISVLATPGYTFDFTGNLPTALDTSLLTGTAQPSAFGPYDGSDNRQYTFQFSGAGTVGSTPGLLMDMYNSSGQLIATFDVGQGYEPDSAIAIGNGVEVRLTAGDVNAGDQFDLPLVAASDTTGFLAATGLNTLFVGDHAGSLSVNQAILEDPNRFASTRTGQPLDAMNAARLLDLRYEPLFGGGSETLEDHFADIIASAGVDVRDLGQIQENLEVIGNSLKAEQQSVSGVDPNEQAIRMLQYQRGFQAAAKYLVTIEESLDELFNIIR